MRTGTVSAVERSSPAGRNARGSGFAAKRFAVVRSAMSSFSWSSRKPPPVANCQPCLLSLFLRSPGTSMRSSRLRLPWLLVGDSDSGVGSTAVGPARSVNIFINAATLGLGLGDELDLRLGDVGEWPRLGDRELAPLIGDLLSVAGERAFSRGEARRERRSLTPRASCATSPFTRELRRLPGVLAGSESVRILWSVSRRSWPSWYLACSAARRAATSRGVAFSSAARRCTSSMPSMCRLRFLF
mmetsp:Transcript_12460/g.37436  ORF Transcript_12460/g.37436 Transcript_12460/m.37436 type:complete len:243 (+) Transcript_12460:863-1591(+)